MGSKQKKLNIGRKLIATASLSLAGMVIVLSLFYNGLSSSLMNERKSQSTRLSQIGMNIIKHFHSLMLNNELNSSQAQIMAMSVLNSATFGKNGYFWINNSNGTLLMHPYSKNSIGQTNINTMDSQGKYLFKDFINTAKNGGGIVEYYWFMPNSSDTFSKVSYVAYFEPWDWILGTGLYLDDLEKEIRHYAFSAFIIVFIFTTIIVVLSISLTRKIVFNLESMAIRDSLTQLYTRRYLNEKMDELKLKYQRNEHMSLSVIFFDIDYFKSINDAYGHAYGDEVLKNVGKIISSTSRPDDLCVRYGGEEFVIIALSEDKDTAINLAERIRAKINNIIFNSNGVEFSITMSAGIAIREEDELISSVIQRADEKLYEAKNNGRDCVIF